jgi:hypothetical protein
LLVVLASLQEVRVIDGCDVLATHARSFQRGAVIEDPKHLEGLVREKQRARKERGLDRLARAAPSSQELLSRLGEQGLPLRTPVQMLLRLLETYGAVELQSALVEALGKDVAHPHAVRHILETRRETRGEKPLLPLALPEDPRIREITVEIPTLEPYDQLKERHGDATQKDTNPTP